MTDTDPENIARKMLALVLAVGPLAVFYAYLGFEISVVAALGALLAFEVTGR